MGPPWGKLSNKSNVFHCVALPPPPAPGAAVLRPTPGLTSPDPGLRQSSPSALLQRHPQSAPHMGHSFGICHDSRRKNMEPRNRIQAYKPSCELSHLFNPWEHPNFGQPVGAQCSKCPGTVASEGRQASDSCLPQSMPCLPGRPGIKLQTMGLWRQPCAPEDCKSAAAVLVPGRK